MTRSGLFVLKADFTCLKIFNIFGICRITSEIPMMDISRTWKRESNPFFTMASPPIPKNVVFGSLCLMALINPLP